MDVDLLALWTLGESGDGEGEGEDTRVLYDGLLAAARGQDTKAVDTLSKYEYELKNVLGGELIHRE